MSGCTRVLQCTIRSQDGGEVQRTVEIKGEGKSYLRCLSEGLSAMQSDVNALLTEMVDKEKSQAAKSGARAESDEGINLMSVCFVLSLTQFSGPQRGRQCYLWRNPVTLASAESAVLF